MDIQTFYEWLEVNDFPAEDTEPCKTKLEEVVDRYYNFAKARTEPKRLLGLRHSIRTSIIRIIVNKRSQSLESLLNELD